MIGVPPLCGVAYYEGQPQKYTRRVREGFCASFEKKKLKNELLETNFFTSSPKPPKHVIASLFPNLIDMLANAKHGVPDDYGRTQKKS